MSPLGPPLGVGRALCAAPRQPPSEDSGVPGRPPTDTAQGHLKGHQPDSTKPAKQRAVLRQVLLGDGLFPWLPQEAEGDTPGQGPGSSLPCKGQAAGCLGADGPLPFLIAGTAGQVRRAVLMNRVAPTSPVRSRSPSDSDRGPQLIYAR